MASRGVRQGNPFFPFLFTLVALSLSRLLCKARDLCLVKGFAVVGQEGLQISHLQFVDDTLVFCEAKVEG